ncbi:helix-turn-helix transcriptional regulator [Oxalobacter aliiformigenes]|uniref:helix-turn-helix domain-containing protein n=1 Tax=Oxalobacter aliiformigenes TaxID=2946593 RepID=UPI0022AEB573|nr:helix-turn-helix transcriptional regulator [Oxalobacter aliiformigenes]MCZ4064191.1 helix-turn-helix transcriptional regulator [Oxalobacter aliiformigenes]WAV99566.1 helix-turn-helix transcriptional regulator [Oxalobacter aliiformigenes]
MDIARYVGCSQPTISDISRGKIRNPSFEIGMALLDLARKNHIEVSEREVS